MNWTDIILFSVVVALVIVNLIYGICVAVRWIWKKTRRRK